MKKKFIFILLCSFLLITKVNASTNAIESIIDLAKTDTTNLAYDGTVDNNLRYIGADPNNYIDIGDTYGVDVYQGHVCTSTVANSAQGSLASDVSTLNSNNSDTILATPLLAQASKTFKSLEACTSDDTYHCNCTKIISKGAKKLWRIIGVMNNMTDENGDKKSLIKIVRDNSIGGYAWDVSDSTINDGYGINEWSQADLMNLLNTSGYWDSTSTTCSYYLPQESPPSTSTQNIEPNNTQPTLLVTTVNLSNTTFSCDFTNEGLPSITKNYIQSVVWNTGSDGANDFEQTDYGLASDFYTYERSNNKGNLCIVNEQAESTSSSPYCSDTVSRTTTWVGKIGLIYPSDFGYATAGGSTTNRANCLTKELYNWDDSSYTDCNTNDWLSNTGWTITPSGEANPAVFSIYSNASDLPASIQQTVTPSAYLLSTTNIDSGTGTSTDPYILSVSNEDVTYNSIQDNFLTALRVARGGSRSKDYLICDSTKADCTKISNFSITDVSSYQSMSNGNTAYKISYDWTCSDASTCFYNETATNLTNYSYSGSSYYEVDSNNNIISYLGNTYGNDNGIENPKTGNSIPYIIFISGLTVALIIFIISKRKAIYKI